MGYRAHVCTTYRVTHGEGHFSHCCEELSDFLNDCSYIDPQTGICLPLVEWEDAEMDAMELSREGLRQLARNLRENPGDLPPLAGGLGGACDAESLAAIFTEWLDTADPDNEFVRIEWY